MELSKILQKCGLEEKEAKVYLELLKIGETTATKIAEKANLDRTLIYQLTNKLIAKGLVSYIIKNNIKFFSAAHPEKLIKDWEETGENLQRILPELVDLTKTSEQETKVEIYRGKEGFKTIMKDMIRERKTIFAFGEEGKVDQIIPVEIAQYANQLEKNKIHEKVLVREDFKGKLTKSKNSEFRYLPKDYLSPSTTVIYGDKVANFIWTSPYYVILTKNKEVADSFKSYFQALWKIAKP